MKALVESRPDGNSDLYKKANIIPLFHGTRTQNLTGIIKKGLLIRPSGVVLCGSMYGNGIYNGLSTKAINYSSINSSYWAKGNDKIAYLFMNDCILGNPYFPKSSGNYNIGAIAPKHSVWAKGGQSGVINDEMILYRTDQNNLKYLLEFSLS
jgi:poly [ADP-ribose] polymerase